jgi:hypothetical protein
MTAHRRVPPRDRQRAIEAVRNGSTFEQAAAQVGATKETVRRWTRAEIPLSERNRLPPRPYDVTPWTEQDVKALQECWDRRMSVSEIGRALGRTRNEVAGKARRLGLASRESPIKRLEAVDVP